jgi:hypothetical protein
MHFLLCFSPYTICYYCAAGISGLLLSWPGVVWSGGGLVWAAKSTGCPHGVRYDYAELPTDIAEEPK